MFDTIPIKNEKVPETEVNRFVKSYGIDTTEIDRKFLRIAKEINRDFKITWISILIFMGCIIPMSLSSDDTCNLSYNFHHRWYLLFPAIISMIIFFWHIFKEFFRNYD